MMHPVELLKIERGISYRAMHAAGAKGGSKGGGAATQPHTDPNTLRSNAKARVIDLLGEGPIEGWYSDNPLKDVFFDQTPVMNADGSLNFQGVTFDWRSGLPDQAPMPGFTESEQPFSVTTRVYQARGPVVRTISNPAATAVRVIVQLPALNRTDTGEKTSGLYKEYTSYAFDVMSKNGAWVEAVNVTINDKCMSPYQRSHRLALPAGGFPWQVRMRRTKADTTDDKIQDITTWDSYFEVVETNQTYMHSAVVGLQVDAQQFGSNLPARSYRIKARKWQVPSNYNPRTRVYTGLWDGTFKEAWTNNPAWVFYGLVTNDRFGLGEFIDATKIDTAGLYQIGQYCDVMIDDGTGTNTKFPRFTFNGSLNTARDADKALQSIAAVFRGMSFWSLGRIFAVADMPKDSFINVTKANTIGGFSYTGTAMKARHTAVLVTWNNPDNFFKPEVLLVQDFDAIRRFGWRDIAVTAEGCTSRAQAHMYGKWLLDTEQNETDTVTYRASFDHLALTRQDDIVTGILPGDIIDIADPRKMRVRAGGRLTAIVSANTFQLDAPFPMTPGATYKIKLTMPNGKLSVLPVASVSATGLVTTIGSPVTPPIPGSVWIITGTDAAPRSYRVMAVNEDEKNIFKVTALFYDPQKFGRVERDLKLPPIPYTRPRTTIAAPSNLSVTPSVYFRDGIPRSKLTLSWASGRDFMSSYYAVSVNTPDRGLIDLGTTVTPDMDLMDTIVGDYTFYVYGVSIAGKASPVAELTYAAEGWEKAKAPTVGNLRIKNAVVDGQFAGTACTLVWDTVFPAGSIPFDAESLVAIYDATTDALLRTDRISHNSYTYSLERNINDGGPRRKFKAVVSVLDVLGRASLGVSLTCSNPAPSMISPIISTGSELIQVRYARPVDTDFAGTMIWIIDNGTYDPLLTAPTYDGTDTNFSMKCEPDTDYWVQAAAYDVFGRVGLNISAKFKIRPKANLRLTFDDLDATYRMLLESMPKVRDLSMFSQTVLRQVTKTDGKARANYSEMLRLDASKNQAIAELSTNLSTEIGDRKSSVTTLQQSVTDLTSAFGTYQVSVATKFGLIESAVDTVATSLSEANRSFAAYQVTVAAKFATTDQAISNNTADIVINATSVATANSAIAALQLLVNATYGSKMANGLLRIIAQPASSDVLVRAEIQVRATNSADPEAGWISAGTFWEVFQDPVGSGAFKARIANKANQFYIIDTSTAATTVPFRVENGVVYVDKLIVGSSNIPQGTVTRGTGDQNTTSTITQTLNVRAGSKVQIIFSYDQNKIIQFTGTGTYFGQMRLYDVTTAANGTVTSTKLKEQSIGRSENRDGNANFTYFYTPTTMIYILTPTTDRVLTIRGDLGTNVNETAGTFAGVSMSVIELGR